MALQRLPALAHAPSHESPLSAFRDAKLDRSRNGDRDRHPPYLYAHPDGYSRLAYGDAHAERKLCPRSPVPGDGRLAL